MFQNDFIAHINYDNYESNKCMNNCFHFIFFFFLAVEIMKLFVFANSIMLIITMAWPNFKEHYYMLREWLESFQVAQ